MVCYKEGLTSARAKRRYSEGILQGFRHISGTMGMGGIFNEYLFFSDAARPQIAARPHPPAKRLAPSLVCKTPCLSAERGNFAKYIDRSGETAYNFSENRNGPSERVEKALASALGRRSMGSTCLFLQFKEREEIK